MKTLFNSTWMLTVLVAVAMLLGVSSCKGRKDLPPDELAPAYGEYVSAYTSGLVSARSNITVELTQPSPYFEEEGGEAPSRLFDISPSVKGRAVWRNSQAVEFIPAEPLKSGERYVVTVQLHKLLDVKEQSLREMVFGLRVIPQSMAVDIEGMVIESSENPYTYHLRGVVRTADVADHDALLSCIHAKHNGRALDVDLQAAEEANAYKLRIGGIERETKSGEVELRWDARPIGGDAEGGERFQLPALGQFEVLSSACEQVPNQAVVVYFSDLLDAKQHLAGLVELSQEQTGGGDGMMLTKSSKLRYHIAGNVLRIYPPNGDVTGSVNLHVNYGVMDAIGQKLAKEYQATHWFERIKPAIRGVGQGVVLPSSEGLVLPFEAINVRAVMVEVIKIYENNIPYYLQRNRMGESQSLNQVGYPVLKKLIDLNQGGVVKPNTWQRYNIDLKSLFSADAGAIYQIKVSFYRNHLLSPCEGVANDQTLTPIDYSAFDDDGYYYIDEDNYYYEDDYEWRERYNPCNPAYYSGYNDTRLIRTLLASDLGIVAKQGNNGDVLVVVNDIPSGRPISGASVRIADYQNQTLVDGKTNSEGMFTANIAKRKAYVVAVSYGGQSGYLRVDNASSLSLTNFDVGGAEVQRGLKGLIYGERGLWRPGDTLHLCFMVEDKTASLPVGHPITLEVHDSRGSLVKRLVRSHSEAGLYYFPVPTDPQAPTGYWQAKVNVGGASFAKTLRVETIKPNRLKIDMSLQNDRIPASGNIDANLSVRWLHGAVASNTKVRYEMTVSKAKAQFDGYGQYTFDDPALSYPTQNKLLWEGTTNAQGNAHIFGSIERSNAMPAALSVKLHGRAFEPSGDFSIDLQSLTYRPYNEFVGVITPKNTTGRQWLETDTDHPVEIATIDAQGKPVTCRNLVLELYKVTWRWWWEQPSSGEASFVSNSHDQLVMRTKVTTENGRGSATIRVDAPQWGRYYLKITNRDNGNSCGTFVYFDWPYSYGQSQGERPGGATVLSLATDKTQYNVDEDIKLTFPGMPRARALISIENGSRVLSAYWVDASQTSNVVAIRVQPEMAPNIYVHVTLIQPHQDKDNDLPIRMFGLVPLSVSNPQTHLKPVIAMPDELKSEQPVSIVVREESGKPMTFTLAVVDEGLLDIDRFATPNPHAVFYAREALGVRTWDLYNEVIGAYGGKMERLLSIGGSDDMARAEANAAQGQTLRFAPVVRFFGPYTVGSRRSQKIEFVMPNYAGSVRVMAIAGQNGAYGMAEKSCPVRNDVMLLATAPRVLGINEEIALPVNIFVSGTGINRVKVNLKTSENISIDGDSEQSVAISSANSDCMVRFRLKTGSATGPARIDLVAESNKGTKATQSIDIGIRNPISEQTKTQSVVLVSDTAATLRMSAFGIAGSNRAIVEASAMPPLNLHKRLKYLIDYPHGCAEQTVSGAFPQIYLKHLLDLNSRQEERIANNVAAAIRRLGLMQMSSGGMGYWPGATNVDEWSTSYAGHFMLEARAAGFDVPQAMLDGWTKFQRNAARQFAPSSVINAPQRYNLLQAYRLYTLAAAGTPEVGAMNKLKERDLELTAKMYLASAYALIGQADIAKRMVDGLALDIAPYRELSYTFGSHLRDRAIVLETLLLLKQQTQAFPVAIAISNEIAGDGWLSTQETAVALIALSKMAMGDGLKTGLKLQYTLNGQQQQVASDKPMAQAELSPIADGANTIVLKHSNKQPIYATVAMTGIPAQGHEQNVERNLTLSVRYTKPDGTSVNHTNLKQGTDIICTVTVGNPGLNGELRELALTQIFPSGWEIRNARLTGDDGAEQSQFTYQDIRDDRVLTYFDLPAGSSKTFSVQLTATYAGRFYMPGPSCQAMYSNDVAAARSGEWVKVVE